MSNSMFFLPCICIIICAIIIAITYTYNKAKDRVVDATINEDIQDTYVCLGDVYINKYSIQSIFLDDNGHMVNIKTDTCQYDYRFTSEGSYHSYLDYLEKNLNINTLTHNDW